MQGARCKVQGVRCQVQVARSKVLVNPCTAKVDFHFIQWQLTVQHSVVVVVVRKCAFYCCGSHSQCGSTIGVGAAAVALPVGGALLWEEQHSLVCTTCNLALPVMQVLPLVGLSWGWCKTICF